MLGKQNSSNKKNKLAEPGMVTVEWALTIPLFLVIVIFCVSILMYSNALALTSNAAREAARSYAIGKGEAAAIEVARAVAGAKAEVEIAIAGEYVAVKVKEPLPPALSFLGVSVASRHLALIEPGVVP